MTSAKVFILGIGAQKSGTTWLEAQLSNADFFSNGGIKEYHVFDMTSEFARKTISERISKRCSKGMSMALKPREAMSLAPEIYFDHFDYLYCKDPKISHVGDITPAYSTLPQETFKIIQDGILDKGFKIKVVFLMRDPVERVWSQARQRIKPKTSAADEFSQLRDLYKRKSATSRTCYEKTSQSIEGIFPVESIYYGFYENLFQQSEIDKLTQFLEAPTLKPNFDERVHATPKAKKKAKGMEDLLAEIRAYYEPTYQWAHSRFGKSLPPTWR